MENPSDFPFILGRTVRHAGDFPDCARRTEPAARSGSHAARVLPDRSRSESGPAEKRKGADAWQHPTPLVRLVRLMRVGEPHVSYHKYKRKFSIFQMFS